MFYRRFVSRSSSLEMEFITHCYGFNQHKKTTFARVTVVQLKRRSGNVLVKITTTCLILWRNEYSFCGLGSFVIVVSGRQFIHWSKESKTNHQLREDQTLNWFQQTIIYTPACVYSLCRISTYYLVDNLIFLFRHLLLKRTS